MRRGVVPAEAGEALAEAVAAREVVKDARLTVARSSDQCRRAVLRANRLGASYRIIGQALGVSLGAVQQLIAAARRLEEQP